MRLSCKQVNLPINSEEVLLDCYCDCGSNSTLEVRGAEVMDAFSVPHNNLKVSEEDDKVIVKASGALYLRLKGSLNRPIEINDQVFKDFMWIKVNVNPLKEPVFMMPTEVEIEVEGVYDKPFIISGVIFGNIIDRMRVGSLPFKRILKLKPVDERTTLKVDTGDEEKTISFDLGKLGEPRFYAEVLREPVLGYEVPVKVSLEGSEGESFVIKAYGSEASGELGKPVKLLVKEAKAEATVKVWGRQFEITLPDAKVLEATLEGEPVKRTLSALTLTLPLPAEYELEAYGNVVRGFANPHDVVEVIPKVEKVKLKVNGVDIPIKYPRLKEPECDVFVEGNPCEVKLKVKLNVPRPFALKAYGVEVKGEGPEDEFVIRPKELEGTCIIKVDEITIEKNLPPLENPFSVKQGEAYLGIPSDIVLEGPEGAEGVLEVYGNVVPFKVVNGKAELRVIPKEISEKGYVKCNNFKFEISLKAPQEPFHIKGTKNNTLLVESKVNTSLEVSDKRGLVIAKKYQVVKGLNELELETVKLPVTCLARTELTLAAKEFVASKEVEIEIPSRNAIIFDGKYLWVKDDENCLKIPYSDVPDGCKPLYQVGPNELEGLSERVLERLCKEFRKELIPCLRKLSDENVDAEVKFRTCKWAHEALESCEGDAAECLAEAGCLSTAIYILLSRLNIAVDEIKKLTKIRPIDCTVLGWLNRTRKLELARSPELDEVNRLSDLRYKCIIPSYKLYEIVKAMKPGMDLEDLENLVRNMLDPMLSSALPPGGNASAFIACLEEMLSKVPPEYLFSGLAKAVNLEVLRAKEKMEIFEKVKGLVASSSFKYPYSFTFKAITRSVRPISAFKPLSGTLGLGTNDDFTLPEEIFEILIKGKVNLGTCEIVSGGGWASLVIACKDVVFKISRDAVEFFNFLKEFLEKGVWPASPKEISRARLNRFKIEKEFSLTINELSKAFCFPRVFALARDVPGLVQERVGRPLGKLLRPEDAFLVGSQVASSLAALHIRDYVLYDVHHTNLTIKRAEEGYVACVVDYSSARKVIRERAETRVEPVFTVRGSLSSDATGAKVKPPELVAKDQNVEGLELVPEAVDVFNTAILVLDLISISTNINMPNVAEEMAKYVSRTDKYGRIVVSITDFINIMNKVEKALKQVFGDKTPKVMEVLKSALNFWPSARPGAAKLSMELLELWKELTNG